MPVQLLAQVSFNGRSGLPEDTFVNTFAFKNPASVDLVANAHGVAGMLQQFYSRSTGGSALDTFISRTVQARFAHIKVYDFAAAKPRPILYQAQWPLSASTAAGIPEEVAICLSYFSVRNIPRYRGRIYVGPLNSTAVTEDPTAGPRPSSPFITALALRASQLLAATDADATTGAGLLTVPPTGSPTPVASEWCVYSRHDSDFKSITAGWIDDEWDTQRRRRIKATGRTVFP